MNKLFFILILTLTIIGCTKEAQSTRSTNNPEFKVDFLFENEGCKVFRFRDSGYNRYYVNCKDSTTTQWQESCGKNCTVEQQVTTVY